MNYILIVTIVLAVLGALLIAHRVNQKESQKRDLKHRAKRIQHLADDIWEIAENTCTLIKSPTIIETLMDYYIYQIRRSEEITNNGGIEDAIKKAEAFKVNHSNIKVKKSLKSDMEINHAKLLFARTSKLLRAAADKNTISENACTSMRNAMKKRMLDLEVDAYERLGDGAGSRSDPAIAANYYKFAKKLLIESDLKFEGKNQRVRDITKKTQSLFGNTEEDQLTRGLKKEHDKMDEHGIPRSVGVEEKKKF